MPGPLARRGFGYTLSAQLGGRQGVVLTGKMDHGEGLSDPHAVQLLTRELGTPYMETMGQAAIGPPIHEGPRDS